MFIFILRYCLDKFINKLNILFRRLDHSNSLHDNKNIVLLKQKYLAVHILEELAFKGKKHGLFMNICQRNRIKQQDKTSGLHI